MVTRVVTVVWWRPRFPSTQPAELLQSGAILLEDERMGLRGTE